MLERSTASDLEAAKPSLGVTSSRAKLVPGFLAEPTPEVMPPAPHLPAATFSQGKATDVRVTMAAMYLLPLTTRMPLKFGAEVITQITCVRVCLAVSDARGTTAEGWGETPLSVQWAWPSEISYETRLASMTDFVANWPKLGPSFLQLATRWKSAAIISAIGCLDC